MKAWQREYENGMRELDQRVDPYERIGMLEGALEAAIIIMRLRDGWEKDYASPSLLETAARHLQNTLDRDPKYVEAKRKRDE